MFRALFFSAFLFGLARSSDTFATSDDLGSGLEVCGHATTVDSDAFAYPSRFGAKKDEDCLKLTRVDGRGDTFRVEAKKSAASSWRELGKLFVHSRVRTAPFGGLASFTPLKGKAQSGFYVQATASEIMVLLATTDKWVQGRPPTLVGVFNGGRTPRAIIECKTDGLTPDEKALCGRVVDPMKAKHGELSVVDCFGPLEDGYASGLCERVDATAQALLRADQLAPVKGADGASGK